VRRLDDPSSLLCDCVRARCWAVVRCECSGRDVLPVDVREAYWSSMIDKASGVCWCVGDTRGWLLLVVNKKKCGRRMERVTFGSLSPLLDIVLDMSMLLSKLCNELLVPIQCVILLRRIHEGIWILTYGWTYLFTFASTDFMSTLQWKLETVHSW
jgi:hypothetical protein